MRALVLSGGGAKGAFQVGALKKWVHEDGMDYDILCGISVGAINSSYLSQFKLGTSTKEMWEKLVSVWNQVDNSKIKKSWCPFGVFESIWKSSVYNSAPLQKWIRDQLDSKAINTSGRKLRVVSVSWNSGESCVTTESELNIADRVIASSSFPIMLSPIEIDNQLWTDGGLRSVTPLGEAIRAGADDIDVIICSNPDAPSPFEPKGKAAIPGLVLRALDIMSDEIMRADLRICGLKNNLVQLDSKYKKVNLRILVPSTPIPYDSLDFSPENIKNMIEMGYKDACNLK